MTAKVLGLMFATVVFAGCTQATTTNSEVPVESQTDSGVMEAKTGTGHSPADNPEYVEVSEDDSLDTLEAEIDATIIDESDFSE